MTEYCESVRRTGGFKHVAPAIVLHPNFNRTHFHLIYATRHDKGLEVFKGAEKRAMAEMEEARGKAQKRRREGKTGQAELFDSEAMHDTGYYDSLRSRYIARAEETVLKRLRSKGRLPYDDAWALALSQPLIWESDLKAFLGEWYKQGKLTIEGIVGRQKAKHNAGHILVWRGN